MQRKKRRGGIVFGGIGAVVLGFAVVSEAVGQWDIGLPFSRDQFRSQSLMPGMGQNSRPNNRRMNPNPPMRSEMPPSDESAEYLPDSPKDWGAPGDPNAESNVDLFEAGDTPPSSGVSLAQYFEEAAPNEPIYLEGENKFLTSDWVRLSGLYYKGSADKNTSPVILLHDKNSSAESLQTVAEQIASAGFAVLVPDLRGCGESTTSWVYDYSAGGKQPTIRQKDDYTIDTFSPDDFQAMMVYDSEVWFRFLLALHHHEKINLRHLSVIGIGYGNVVAANWIGGDLSASNTKNGRFTKNFVLVSPVEDRVFSSLADLKLKPGTLEIRVVAGNLGQGSAPAEKVRQALEKIKSSPPPKDKSPPPQEEKKFELVPLKTERQGTDLLGVKEFDVTGKIIDFLSKRTATPTAGPKWSPIK